MQGSSKEHRAGTDPVQELMLEQAARDAAELRRQMAQVRVVSGALAALVGLVVAVGTMVSFAATARAAATAPGGAGLRAGFFGVAMLFGVVVFGFGLWLLMRGLSDQ